jgi:hypothetical protein
MKKIILVVLLTMGVFFTESSFGCKPTTTCPDTQNNNRNVAIAGAQATSKLKFNAEKGSFSPSATGGTANSSSSARLSDSGNSNVENTYEVPISLLTPEMIAPVVLKTELYPFLSAANGQEVDGVSIIFTDGRNIIPIRAAMSVKGVKILKTQQNHGKKFLATLHSRSDEYVGPMEQVREMRENAPKGTKCMLIGLNTITHTRGTAGIVGTGNNQNDWTSAISANLAGSIAIPLVMTTATFIDKKITVVNCNDPVFFKEELCVRQFRQGEK